jgi:hypothetical protein
MGVTAGRRAGTWGSRPSVTPMWCARHTEIRPEITAMGTHLMQRLNAFSDAFSVFLLWLQHNPVILSLFAGLTLPFIFICHARKEKTPPSG